MSDIWKNYKWQTHMLIGIVAGFLSGLADIIMLYAPSGGYHLKQYDFLLEVSRPRLIFGHFLGIICIPITLLGHFWVSRGFEPINKTLPNKIFGLVVFILFPGVTYHGCFGLLQLIKQSDDAQNLVELSRVFMDPLTNFMLVILFLMSGGFAFLVWKKETHFSKSTALLNPAVLILVMVAIHFCLPNSFNFLLISAFNFGNAIFLLIAYLDLKKKYKTEL